MSFGVVYLQAQIHWYNVTEFVLNSKSQMSNNLANKSMKKIMLLLVIGLLMYSCKPSPIDEPSEGLSDDPTEEPSNVSMAITVKMEEPTTDATDGSTIVRAIVTCGESKDLMVGFIWSTKENPTFEDQDKGYWGRNEYGDLIEYEYHLNLKPNIAYHIVAYAFEQRFDGIYDSIHYSEYIHMHAAVKPKDLYITDIEVSSAKFSAVIDENAKPDVIARGFCWSTHQNPTIEDSHTTDGEGVGWYSSVVEGLEGFTKYYVRAYAVNSDMTVGYSSQQVFKTMHEYTIDGYINGYAYVDLGLPSGLKWATYNIDGSSVVDFGNYYTWGQTTPGAECITYGVEMDDFSGDPQYDAASANWGSTWRLPTKAECEELKNNCEWEFISYKGVRGIVLIGPNNNAIFLPSTYTGYNVYGGGYWTSTPYENGSNQEKHNKYAYVFSFDETMIHGEYLTNLGVGMTYRTGNKTLRAVSE